MPQLFTSLDVLAQPVPQHVSPVAHPAGPHAPAQTPPEHVSPGAHAWPHDPQLVGDAARFVSQPSDTRALQSAKPPSQSATVHIELVQPADA